MIGASIRYGKHRQNVHEFIARHRKLLEARASRDIRAGVLLCLTFVPGLGYGVGGNNNWINLGGKIITFFGNGIKNMAGFVASSVKGLMEQPIAFIKGLPQQFMGWGKDMIQGLIDGITGMIGNVAGAIGSVADKIASIIHFSRPDEGPLLGAARPMTLSPGRAVVVRRGQTDQLVQIGWTEPP